MKVQIQMMVAVPNVPGAVEAADLIQRAILAVIEENQIGPEISPMVFQIVLAPKTTN